ncbi:MAG: insulinase family protein [Acidobacteriota bacterium]|nr:insulinase family protein [Acidobacteriota bacterium]
MNKLKFNKTAFLIFSFALFAGLVNAQTALPTPPPPSAPRPVKIPDIKETTLPNGLRVAVIERKNVPLVTATLLVKSGAGDEGDKAGLADLTASLLLKGTKTRSATQIAEQIEFLGGNINSGANWLNSNVSVNVTSDKIESAMTVMSDAILNPAFAQSEIDLLKTQTLDELNVALKQPSTLANFAAARYTFGEHVAAGTPESLAKLTRSDIVNFHHNNYFPGNSVLLFVGDISPAQAETLARKYFSAWKQPVSMGRGGGSGSGSGGFGPIPLVERILVIDLPNSGQAAVTYAKRLSSPRTGADYYPAIVTNSVLGGGYSARLNEEIRIKRGLSYGAGSSFTWRIDQSNFATRGQTKNISAAEVAELTVKEIEKMATGDIELAELTPRKLSLTGGFGRELSTNGALTQRLIELYAFNLKPQFFGSYIADVEKVSDANIKTFVSSNLKGGDLIIVGDYKIFADDLKKRFPNQKIEVIPASELDLSKDNLRK